MKNNILIITLVFSLLGIVPAIAETQTVQTNVKPSKIEKLKFWNNLNFKKDNNKRENTEIKELPVQQIQEPSQPKTEEKNIKPVKDKKTFLNKFKKTKKQDESASSKEEVKPATQSNSAFEPEKLVQGSVATDKVISVDDCVKIALENNPSIMSQLMNKEIYKNKIAQAWANYFPTINLGVSYSKNDMLMTNFKFPMQKYDLWNTPSVGVNMLLYDFGKTSTTAKISKKTFEAAENTMQENINDVIYQVKSAYYNLLYALQQVNVYEDTVMNYEIHLKQAQAYYEIGSKAKIDVTTAAYNLDNAKLSLITAKNAVDSAYASLNNAMGVPEFSNYNIQERLDSKKYGVDFDELIKTANDVRPELIAAKKKMEGSQLLIRASKTAFLPDIKGFGNYTKGGKNPDTDYGYQIGAQIAYSNTNLFLLKKQVDEAKLTYKKDLADYEIAKQNLYLQVKQAYIQLKNAQESVPVAHSSMMVAKEQYELASGRYKVGLGDAIELKDAENTYRTSQLSYYNTLMQYHISAANLEKVVGTPIKPTESDL